MRIHTVNKAHFSQACLNQYRTRFNFPVYAFTILPPVRFSRKAGWRSVKQKPLKKDAACRCRLAGAGVL
jgi:hypothetical protein